MKLKKLEKLKKLKDKCHIAPSRAEVLSFNSQWSQTTITSFIFL